jgi:hypothetical protein
VPAAAARRHLNLVLTCDGVSRVVRLACRLVPAGNQIERRGAAAARRAAAHHHQTRIGDTRERGRTACRNDARGVAFLVAGTGRRTIGPNHHNKCPLPQRGRLRRRRAAALNSMMAQVYRSWIATSLTSINHGVQIARPFPERRLMRVRANSRWAEGGTSGLAPPGGRDASPSTDLCVTEMARQEAG